jgi:hypothetical protein
MYTGKVVSLNFPLVQEFKTFASLRIGLVESSKGRLTPECMRATSIHVVQGEGNLRRRLQLASPLTNPSENMAAALIWVSLDPSAGWRL